jgi:aspartyl protease family protein
MTANNAGIPGDRRDENALLRSRRHKRPSDEGAAVKNSLLTIAAAISLGGCGTPSLPPIEAHDDVTARAEQIADFCLTNPGYPRCKGVLEVLRNHCGGTGEWRRCNEVRALAYAPQSSPQPSTPIIRDATTRVPLFNNSGGTKSLHATINGSLRVAFALDTGAADVVISPRVANALMDNGTLSEVDYIRDGAAKVAGGSRVETMHVRLRSIQVGDKIVHNLVAVIIMTPNDTMLLGQSFLKNFRSYAVDNATGELVLG